MASLSARAAALSADDFLGASALQRNKASAANLSRRAPVRRARVRVSPCAHASMEKARVYCLHFNRPVRTVRCEFGWLFLSIASSEPPARNPSADRGPAMATTPPIGAPAWTTSSPRHARV